MYSIFKRERHGIFPTHGRIPGKCIFISKNEAVM
jgi:hypothetical protein